MSDLFMALYLDEDVSVLIGDLTRARGFTVLTTYEAGRAGALDADQLQFASSQRHVLLTHNRRDFETLARQYVIECQQHAGLILAVRRPPYDLASRLLALINQVTADEMVQQVQYI